jgi:dipeptidase E
MKIIGKLVLYSDQMIAQNKKIDIELLRLIGKEKPKIGYIASASDLTRKYYNQKVEYYKNLGVEYLLYFDLDKEYDEAKIDELLSCDAIHLSGGNTYYFLNSLQKRNFIPVLEDYVSKGKVLVGISAGSILMSKTIDIAQFGDENFLNLKNTHALDLIDFEFMPHWNTDFVYLDGVKNYSKINNNTIYACKDGDGIIIDNNKMRFFGEIIKIENGNKV